MKTLVVTAALIGLSACIAPTALDGSLLNQVAVTGTLAWPDGTPVSAKSFLSFSVIVTGLGQTQCNSDAADIQEILSGGMQAYATSTSDALVSDSASAFSLSLPLQNNPDKGGQPNVVSYIYNTQSCPAIGYNADGSRTYGYATAWSLESVSQAWVEVKLANTAENCAGYCNGGTDASCVANCTASTSGVFARKDQITAGISSDPTTGEVTLSGLKLKFNSLAP